MNHTKKSTGVFCLFILIFMTNIVKCKSLYVISNFRVMPQIKTYDIANDNLNFVYDANITVDIAFPTDITVHESDYGKWMFCTIEYTGIIERINLQTRKPEERITVPNAHGRGMAGIVIDKDKSKLYAMDRFTNRLWSYSWNPITETLTLDFNDPYYIELEGIEYGEPVGAFGITLDEENDLLYVADNTHTIEYYNTNDWSLAGELNVDCNAISVAIDENNQRLYYGSIGEGYGDGDPCLYQYNLLTDESDSVYIGNAVAGIAVDQQTGLVYITTSDEGINETKYKLMIYDVNLTLHSTPIQLGCPTGLTVAEIGYRHPCFEIVKDDNDADCVYPLISQLEHEWLGTPYNWLYYNINWDANGFADSNVVITDFLPFEVNEPNFISDGGEYLPDLHAVRWNVGDVSAQDSNQFKIQAAVNYYANPCGTIRNKAVIEGDHYFDQYAIDTNVCYYGGDIIYVDRDTNGWGNGTNWQDAYKDLQEALECARSSCAEVVAIWVANGVYKPVQNPYTMTGNETFELIPNVGLFGHFAGGEESTLDRDFNNPANETVLEGLIGTQQSVASVVKAEDIEYPDYTIIDGFTVRNAQGDGLYIDNSYAGIVNCKFQNNYYGVRSIYSWSDIHNCIFFNNFENGLYAFQLSRPVVSYSVFDGNGITNYGIYTQNYSVIDVNNCIFKNHPGYNSSSGCGILADNGTITVVDSNFIDNWYGLNLSNTSTTLTNCSVTDSIINGISCSNSDLTVKYSIISNSSYNGASLNSGCNLTLKNSVISYNGNEGLELFNNLTSSITNNWIYNNGTAENLYEGCSGIYLNNHSMSPPFIRNNTLYGNYTYGIQMSHSGGEPNISNCIIYGNDANDLYRENGSFNNVRYSCLQSIHSGIGNIVADPCFVDTDSNNLRIIKDSRCRNAGDPNGNYSGETDIDDQGRVQYGRVDIGGDEFYGGLADYDENGIVNFLDYRYLAQSWKQNQTDYSLDDDNDVDIYDLTYFAGDWLWQENAEQSRMMCMSTGDDEDSLENDNLMLSTAIESLSKRPQRLIEGSQKFYDITPAMTISAKQRELESLKAQRAERMHLSKAESISLSDTSKVFDVNEILNWLDELWKSDEEFKESMSEQEYLEFRKSIEKSEE
ncbi:MAG: right-handed parallel beta-helix repeat-containing protein [Phycisphaerae bacterium]|jgi:hypothetical protein